MRMKEPTQQYSDLINSLQSRIQALEDENRLLKERLDEAGVSYADIVSGDAEGVVELYDPDQGARIKKFDVTDKIASDFFMMFCRGRKDLYDLRYTNPKTGKNGYYTQCFNRWDRGCHIQKKDGVRCKDCELRAYKPVTLPLIKAHMNGTAEHTKNELKESLENDEIRKKEEDSYFRDERIFNKALNIWVMKYLWKKYRNTYGIKKEGIDINNSFYDAINIPETTVRRIFDFQNTRENKKKAEEAEKKTGIPQNYLLGLERLIISPESDIQEKLEQYMKNKWTECRLIRLYNEADKEEKDKEEEKDTLDLISESILQEVDIEEEYNNLIKAMEGIKEVFQSKYDESNNEKFRNTFNDFLSAVIDVVSSKKEEIGIKLRIHNIGEYKNIVYESIAEINKKFAEVGNIKKEIMEILDRLELSDLQEGDDMYKVLYYIKYNKKYETGINNI